MLDLPDKLLRQIGKAGLPANGSTSFEPRLKTNRAGEPEIEKVEVKYGPKKGKKGYLDVKGRIWIRERAHAGLPDHWDVQIDSGKDYIRVDNAGNEI